MVVKLADLDRWEEISFDHEVPQSYPKWARVENAQYVTIRVRPRYIGWAQLFVTIYEGDDAESENPEEWMGGASYPLVPFEGFTEIQFWAPAGGFRIANSDIGPEAIPHMPVMIDMAQGENWVMPPEDGESFARVMERAPRNEEYEQMLAVTMRNVERRMAQERSETARVLAEMDRLHRAELAEARAVGSADEGAGKPRKKVVAPSVDGGAPDETAGGDEGGGGGNDDNAVA